MVCTVCVCVRARICECVRVHNCVHVRVRISDFLHLRVCARIPANSEDSSEACVRTFRRVCGSMCAHIHESVRVCTLVSMCACACVIVHMCECVLIRLPIQHSH